MSFSCTSGRDEAMPLFIIKQTCLKFQKNSQTDTRMCVCKHCTHVHLVHTCGKSEGKQACMDKHTHAQRDAHMHTCMYTHAHT